MKVFNDELDALVGVDSRNLKDIAKEKLYRLKC